jgi:hypothetical protein
MSVCDIVRFTTHFANAPSHSWLFITLSFTGHNYPDLHTLIQGTHMNKPLLWQPDGGVG